MDNYHVPQIPTGHSQQHPTCQANKRLCQLISQAISKEGGGNASLFLRFTTESAEIVFSLRPLRLERSLPR